MRRGAVLIIGLLTLLTGCPRPERVPPTSRREALLRINDNLAQLDQPVQAKALVSFTFRDSAGKVRRFLGHEAALLFRAPQSLCFDIRSLAGVIAQFGSNEQFYWVWVEPEVRKLWWGEWRRAREGELRKLPIPPNELLDALMLRPLAETLEGSLLPLLRVEGDDHRLLFVRLGIDRQPSGLREIRLDPLPPYQPLEIIDRLPDGKVAMHAVLSGYRRIGANGPYTPRRYVVNWPENGAEMRLDILTETLRPDLPAEVFDFPAEWQGDSEKIDEPATNVGRTPAETGTPQ